MVKTMRIRCLILDAFVKFAAVKPRGSRLLDAVEILPV
jgi:hypothetical protein